MEAWKTRATNGLYWEKGGYNIKPKNEALKPGTKSHSKPGKKP